MDQSFSGGSSIPSCVSNKQMAQATAAAQAADEQIRKKALNGLGFFLSRHAEFMLTPQVKQLYKTILAPGPPAPPPTTTPQQQQQSTPSDFRFEVCFLYASDLSTGIILVHFFDLLTGVEQFAAVPHRRREALTRGGFGVSAQAQHCGRPRLFSIRTI